MKLVSVETDGSVVTIKFDFRDDQITSISGVALLHPDADIAEGLARPAASRKLAIWGGSQAAEK